MAVSFHVNGVATLQAYGIVTSDTWTTVGYSKDGITISLNYETEDIFTDRTGPKIPEDVMDYGQWATVKCQMIKYDVASIESLETRLNGDDNTPGLLPNAATSGGALYIGTLMGQCGLMTPIAILRGSVGCEGTPYEGGWQFNGSYLMGSDSFQVGTKVTIHDLEFRCLPDGSNVLFTVLGSAGPGATPNQNLW